MSDERTDAERAQARDIILGAIASAPARSSFRYESTWKAHVNANIGHIAAMLGSDRSRQMLLAFQMIDSTMFIATYMGHEIEASSKRLIVTVQTDQRTKSKPEGMEQLRTERTDNPIGEEMQKRLDGLRSGDEILVWKHVEVVSDEVKVRVMPHFEFRRRGDQNAGPATSPRREPAGPPVEDEAAPPVASSSGGSTDDVQTLNNLDTKTKMTVMRRLREEGVPFPPTNDQESNRFHSIIDEEVGR